MADLEVNISDLRCVISRILDHIEQDLGETKISVTQDSYWDVADEQRYDFTKQPIGFEHGQLVDDWQFLSAILTDKDQAVALMLKHVAPLLRRIGEQIEG